jgi:hypothetical protein
VMAAVVAFLIAMVANTFATTIMKFTNETNLTEVEAISTFAHLFTYHTSHLTRSIRPPHGILRDGAVEFVTS